MSPPLAPTGSGQVVPGLTIRRLLSGGQEEVGPTLRSQAWAADAAPQQEGMSPNPARCSRDPEGQEKEACPRFASLPSAASSGDAEDEKLPCWEDLERWVRGTCRTTGNRWCSRGTWPGEESGPRGELLGLPVAGRGAENGGELSRKSSDSQDDVQIFFYHASQDESNAELLCNTSPASSAISAEQAPSPFPHTGTGAAAAASDLFPRSATHGLCQRASRWAPRSRRSASEDAAVAPWMHAVLEEEDPEMEQTPVASPLPMSSPMPRLWEWSLQLAPRERTDRLNRAQGVGLSAKTRRRSASESEGEKGGHWLQRVVEEEEGARSPVVRDSNVPREHQYAAAPPPEASGGPEASQDRRRRSVSADAQEEAGHCMNQPWEAGTLAGYGRPQVIGVVSQGCTHPCPRSMSKSVPSVVQGAGWSQRADSRQQGRRAISPMRDDLGPGGRMCCAGGQQDLALSRQLPYSVPSSEETSQAAAAMWDQGNLECHEGRQELEWHGWTETEGSAAAAEEGADFSQGGVQAGLFRQSPLRSDQSQAAEAVAEGTPQQLHLWSHRSSTGRRPSGEGLSLATAGQRVRSMKERPAGSTVPGLPLLALPGADTSSAVRRNPSGRRVAFSAPIVLRPLEQPWRAQGQHFLAPPSSPEQPEAAKCPGRLGKGNPEDSKASKSPGGLDKVSPKSKSAVLHEYGCLRTSVVDLTRCTSEQASSKGGHEGKGGEWSEVDDTLRSKGLMASGRSTIRYGQGRLTGQKLPKRLSSFSKGVTSGSGSGSGSGAIAPWSSGTSSGIMGSFMGSSIRSSIGSSSLGSQFSGVLRSSDLSHGLPPVARPSPEHSRTDYEHCMETSALEYGEQFPFFPPSSLQEQRGTTWQAGHRGDGMRAVDARGMVNQEMTSQGVVAQGMGTLGTGAEGMGTQGVNSQEMNTMLLALLERDMTRGFRSSSFRSSRLGRNLMDQNQFTSTPELRPRIGDASLASPSFVSSSGSGQPRVSLPPPKDNVFLWAAKERLKRGCQ